MEKNLLILKNTDYRKRELRMKYLFSLSYPLILLLLILMMIFSTKIDLKIYQLVVHMVLFVVFSFYFCFLMWSMRKYHRYEYDLNVKNMVYFYSLISFVLIIAMICIIGSLDTEF